MRKRHSLFLLFSRLNNLVAGVTPPTLSHSTELFKKKTQNRSPTCATWLVSQVQAEFFSPLDESLQGVSIDLSGHPSLVYDVTIPTKMVGRYETRLMEPFFAALVKEASIKVHIQRLTPAKNCNSHHIIEATFKAFARAMRQAIDKMDVREPQVGTL
jgi:hypothetical protein